MDESSTLSRLGMLRVLFGLILSIWIPTNLLAQEQRARPPVFDDAVVSRVFFSDLSSAFRGERPTLSSLRKLEAASMAQAQSEESDSSSEGAASWNKLITPISLEDEIKRVKLKYDASITTPGAFNGGGYRDARLHLTVMASLFAVISEYSGDVRWKSDSKTARDLLAKTALNCAAGSTPAYKEAELRKADLQDLVSGAGMTAAKTSDAANEWTMIADRSPLMEYVEILLDGLGDNTRDEATIRDNVDAVRRQAELIALVGQILVQEGMDEADDADYVALSTDMTKASRSVVAAIERQDFGSIGQAVGAITQSCDACHEQYR